MKRFMTKKLLVVGVAVALVIGIGGAAFAYFTSTGGGTGSAAVGTASNLTIQQIGNTPLYNSTISPLPASQNSYGVEAYYFDELGNEVNLGSSAPLYNVVVTMDSWACETGSWTVPYRTAGDCVTTPGTTYPAPITFNIYNTGSVGQVGSLIATDTQTFAVPYRPSASSSCSNGEWLASDGCQYGLATNITFNFSSQHVTLPTEVVYGIAYNSTHNGYAPLSGSGSPMDSLNIAFSDDATNISAGTDADSGTLFMAQSATYTATSQIACVGPFTAGRFQQYSTTCNVLSPPQNNIPAVQFNAAGSGVGDLYPGGASQPINFTVTNPGGSDGQISSVTIAVSSISQTPAGLLLGVCNPLWFGITQPTSPVNVTIPPGGTLTYDPSGASIALGESHTDQDMCQGATVNLSFTSN